MVPTFSHMNPLHTLQFYFFHVCFAIITPSMTRSSKQALFSGRSTTSVYAFISSLIRATRPVHLILFHFIMLLIFENECINHESLTVSTPLQDINISSFNAMDHVSNPYKQQAKLQIRIY